MAVRLLIHALQQVTSKLNFPFVELTNEHLMNISICCFHRIF